MIAWSGTILDIPTMPTARHSEALWQRTPRKVTPLEGHCWFDQVLPPSLEVKISSFPTATQVVGAAHETAKRPDVPDGTDCGEKEPPPLVERAITPSPELSAPTATQESADAHDTPLNAPAPGAAPPGRKTSGEGGALLPCSAGILVLVVVDVVDVVDGAPSE
jgi:hypothetical protein